MNHSELVAQIAEAGGISKADAKKNLELVVETISGALAKGEEVRIQNLGTFKVKHNAAKQARNPKDGSIIDVPAKKVAKFQVAKPLADKVNA